jgi:hypothetical protein
MPWTLRADSRGRLSVDLDGDKCISITPRDVALLALGLLLHDIAKPYVLKGERHALLGYEYLEDPRRFREVLKELCSKRGIEPQLLSNISDNELVKIREVILLHHMGIDKNWYGSISNKIGSINNKLAVLFSRPFDLIASSVYGFVSKELTDDLSSKFQGEFIQVNPFSRIPTSKIPIQISGKKTLSDALSDMMRDSVEVVVKKYLECARERTFEPACDIPLYDHGVFTASLSLMLCNYATVGGIDGFSTIDENTLKEIFKKYVSNVKLAWLVVDITGLWSLVERSVKPDDLAGFAYLVNAYQRSLVGVISEYATQKLRGCSDDPLLREIVKEILVPLTRQGSVIISLLPENVAYGVQRAFEGGELLQKVRDEVLKTLNSNVNIKNIEVDLERILRYGTMISVASADFQACQDDDVYACVARELQEKLNEAFRSLSALQVLEKPPKPPEEPCWYCGVNQAVESVDIYYYGSEDVPVKACRACQYVRKLGERLVQASKIYAEIVEEGNIGLIALVPRVRTFYAGWNAEIHRIVYAQKNLKNIRDILNKTISKLSSDEFKIHQSLEIFPNILEKILETSGKKDIEYYNIKRMIDSCIGPVKNFTMFIKGNIHEFEAAFSILDKIYSYRLAEYFIRTLNNIYWIIKYCEAPPKSGAEVLEYYCKLLMLYYDLLIEVALSEELFGSLENIFDATYPFTSTLSVIIERNIKMAAPLFMAHPARLMARERFWSETLEEISRKLGNAPMILGGGGNYLFVVVPGEQVWEALGKILEVLEGRGFSRGCSVLGPFTWEVLDAEGPAAALSVFIAGGKYPMYRLLRTAFELARRPFVRGESRYPVRCFLADVRTGFDPAPGAHSLVPLWLFAHLFDAVEGADEGELTLAHRLMLAGGYDKAHEAVAATVRRGFERGLRGALGEALEIERMRLDPSIYYVIASLINLKRYCQAS